MIRFLRTILATLVVLLAAASTVSAAEAKQPNIVLILADDK